MHGACHIYRIPIPRPRMESDLARRRARAFIQTETQPADEAEYANLARRREQDFQLDFAFNLFFPRVRRVTRLRLESDFDRSFNRRGNPDCSGRGLYCAGIVFPEAGACNCRPGSTPNFSLSAWRIE